MGRSSLTRTGEQKPAVGLGHGTGSLGPSDTSDSGSDLKGGPGVGFDANNPMRLDTGTTSDMNPGRLREDAGPDVGDGNLDSDSDAGGTGERAAAGRDTEDYPRDITADRTFSVPGAAPAEGNRDFSSRRPGRGNRLRRGLRSRRKSFRQG